MLHSVECIVVYEMKRIMESVYRVFLRVRWRSIALQFKTKNRTAFHTIHVYCMYAVLKRFIRETCYFEYRGVI
jgi:hypothetical protein